MATAMNMPGVRAPQLAPTIEPLVGGAVGQVRAALDRLASLGFRHVQLSATMPGMRPRDLDRSARRDILATLRRSELAVAGLDAWIPAQHFLDAAHVDRAIAAMEQTIELAADLGRCPVSFTLPRDPAGRESGGESMHFIIEAISAVADRMGVLVADHGVPVAEHAGASMMVGVGIDPAAWLSHNMDPIAAVSAHAERLYAARLCDLLHTGLRGPVGNRQEGRLDVLGYQVALSVAGYARPVVLDARQWPDAWGGLTQSRDVWEGEQRK